MSNKWNMIVDVAECCGCFNCSLACKDEYSGNDVKGYFSSHPRQGKAALDVEYHEKGSYPNVEAYYMPVMCNHCDDAPCMRADKDGAISKRADGIVVFDPEKSRGNRNLMAACPYGAVRWNEETDTPQTWIFDAHLLDRGWKQPRGVDSCPTGALKAIKVSDSEMQDMAQAEGLTTLLPERKTKPRVYYRNAHLISDLFIAGALRVNNDGVSDCIEGASVRLLKDGSEIGQTTSDAFGDFKISGLTANLGACTLEISAADRAPLTLDVEIADDCLDIGQKDL